MRNPRNDNTRLEVGLIIASLGMYAYLKNCVDKREKSLSSPSAVVKIALAVLLPPVAMAIGVFSLFSSSDKPKQVNRIVANRQPFQGGAGDDVDRVLSRPFQGTSRHKK